MKKIWIGLLSLFVLLSIGAQNSEYPPAGWNADFSEAVEEARAEDKWLLLNFTGSDWCVWCKRLSEAVFSTEEFLDWAEDNAVLVFLDFPSSIEQSEAQKMQNAYLQQFLGIQGYPSIWLFDSDLSPLLATGYRDDIAADYIWHLENDRPNVTQADLEEMGRQFQEFYEENILPLDL